MLRFLIAGDHTPEQQDMKRTLAESFRDVTFGEAQNIQETKNAIQRQSWSAIVLDISMLGSSALNVLRLLRRRHLNTPVLVLSAENRNVVRALKGGAAGFLTRQSASRELADAIRVILSGGRYISPDAILCAVRAGGLP
jgi:two-component system, NarL family, invasion response regulator UvrY